MLLMMFHIVTTSVNLDPNCLTSPAGGTVNLYGGISHFLVDQPLPLHVGLLPNFHRPHSRMLAVFSILSINILAIFMHAEQFDD